MTDTKALPTTPAEWEEYVNDTLNSPEKFQAAYADGSFAEAMKAYTGATSKTMTDLKNEVTEQVSASVLEMFKRNGVETDGRPDVRPANERAVRAGTAYNKYGSGAPLDKIWNSAGQFFQDVILNKKNGVSAEGRARLEQYDKIVNAYSGQVPAQGGFLIPEEVRADIMTRALEGAIVRPQAQVVPMPTGKFRWPVVDFTTEVGEVYGGMQMVWLDEGETFSETEASFASLALTAHKLGGLASVPNELIRHIMALEAWLRTNMPNAIRHFEDIGFLTGDGVAKPLGALSASNPSLIVASAEQNQPTATITWNNVLAMFSRLLPESYATAEWIISPDCIPEIFTMALPVGTGGSAVMFGEGGGPNRLAQSMLGIPIRWSRKTPGVLGTQGDISLVDLSTYVIGDTTSVQLDTSEHSSFRSDKTDFRIIEEVDGQPGLLSALTPANNGPTLSAYVQLATR